MAGVAGADGVSYGACQQGCRCLMESEAKTQFGNNYVQCSDTKCGEKTAGTGDVAISIPMYCYKAKEPAPSYAACPSGCQCLFEYEIPTVFGESGRNYVKCSETPCGKGSDEVVRQYKYCFRVPSPAQRPVVVQPQAPPPGASTGSLSISSSPSGAVVTIDGQYRGTTAVTISGLSPGYHNLRLSLSGYQDSTQSPSVSAGSITALSVPLVPVSGQGVSVGFARDQVGVVSLQEDQVSVISLADDRDKLNPQPEPPKPADYTKLNPQPEPPKPADYTKLNPQPEPPRPDDYTKLNPQPEPPKPSSGGFVDSVFSFFTGLFAGNIQNKLQTASQTGMGAPSPQQLMDYGTCGLGMTKCNDQCVNTKNDPDNCGVCNAKCPSPKSCGGGKCGDDCGVLLNCERHCVHTLSDKDNCGGCGMKCAADQICDGGGCKCIGSIPMCNGACTDVNTNVNNCGACGNKCGDGQVCSGGKCQSLANAKSVEMKSGSVIQAAANIPNTNTIRILSPNEGDVYYWGEPVQISWNKNDLPEGTPTVRILIYRLDLGPEPLLSVIAPNMCDSCGSILWNSRDWPQVPPSGDYQFIIRITNDDKRYQSFSRQFTIKDNPFAQDIEQKNTGIEKKNIGTAVKALEAAMFHINVRSPEKDSVITQGDTVTIAWDTTDIKNYDTVKMELFNEDGTWVTTVGTWYTGLNPNTGSYEWRTHPAPKAGELPDRSMSSIQRSPGRSYIKISTQPDGKYTGNSPVFTINANPPLEHPLSKTFTIPLVVGHTEQCQSELADYKPTYLHWEGLRVGWFANSDSDKQTIKDRAWIHPDMTNLIAENPKIAKATLKLHYLSTEVKYDVAMPKTSRLGYILYVNEGMTGFEDWVQGNGVVYRIPNSVGTGCSFDRCTYDSSNYITIDIFSIINQWMRESNPNGYLILVASDEDMADKIAQEGLGSGYTSSIYNDASITITTHGFDANGQYV